MIDKFLKAKHWHIFLLMIGIPIIFQIIITYLILSDTNLGPGQQFNFMRDFFILFPIMMILFTGLLFGWFWSISIGLQKRMPESIKMKVKKFKILFFIPLCYINLLLILMSISLLNVSPENNMSLGFMENMIAIILPLHLLSIFCMLYIIYFTAKTLKTVELQKEAKFGDFIGYFFALWFYFFGVWYIQPKVNKIAQRENNNTIDDIGKIDTINI
ncbi:MAG: hypothetical protein ABJL44_03805 [Algibacter sp.]